MRRCVSYTSRGLACFRGRDSVQSISHAEDSIVVCFSLLSRSLKSHFRDLVSRIYPGPYNHTLSPFISLSNLDSSVRISIAYTAHSSLMPTMIGHWRAFVIFARLLLVSPLSSDDRALKLSSPYNPSSGSSERHAGYDRSKFQGFCR